jgi:hypothetical protein
MPDTIGVLDKDGNAVTVKTNDALHTQLAAILAKLIAAPATEAKQDTLITAAEKATRHAAVAATVSGVDWSASSQSLFAATTALLTESRVIHNASDVMLYVNEGATASIAKGGFVWQVEPGDTLEIDTYFGALSGIFAADGTGYANTSIRARP